MEIRYVMNLCYKSYVVFFTKCMEFYSHRESEVPETGLSACTKQKKSAAAGKTCTAREALSLPH